MKLYNRWLMERAAFSYLLFDSWQGRLEGMDYFLNPTIVNLAGKLYSTKCNINLLNIFRNAY